MKTCSILKTVKEKEHLQEVTEMNEKEKRFEALMETMTPCSKELYFKEEIEKEMSALKQVIVNCTYNEEHAVNIRLGLCDVLEHLKAKNEERDGIAL